MKAITIRNILVDLASALDRGKRRCGQSPNRTVVELLRQSLGVGTTRSDGLARLACGWTDEQAGVMEEALAPFGKIDAEMCT